MTVSNAFMLKWSVTNFVQNFSLMSKIVKDKAVFHFLSLWYHTMGTVAFMIYNKQRFIAKNMSHTYCLNVTKFHCTNVSGLRAVQ